VIVSDNGTELTSHAILGWQAERGVACHYIAPGKPMQNGLVESLMALWRTNAGMPERAPVQEPASSPAHAQAEVRTIADQVVLRGQGRCNADRRCRKRLPWQV
jgi:transposase InsO family protein